MDLDFDKLDELKKMETRMEQINEKRDKKFNVDIADKEKEPERPVISHTESSDVGTGRSL
ncbi:hypothetical protein GUA46_06790 [Muricauda sp. HICW]|uniref:Uncharacterized protein n=1 Tax=Flagellimonas chongwuensis TaxID=2697365 RepID=A0A850NGL4_9FLAO|nr:hypothetical protein [Allomuricauda chongwuensis]NVN18040.1 hypothetical protein [Allomuricauda chongwuensis]